MKTASLDAYTASADTWKAETDALHASAETCKADAEAKAKAVARTGPGAVALANARIEAAFCWKVLARASRVLAAQPGEPSEASKLAALNASRAWMVTSSKAALVAYDRDSSTPLAESFDLSHLEMLACSIGSTAPEAWDEQRLVRGGMVRSMEKDGENERVGDSINPKPLTEGIAEEPLNNWHRLWETLAQDQSSADPIMSSTSSSTPSSPNLGSSIRFGSYEFTPHSDSSRSNFSDLQGNMEMTIGSIHYNVKGEGILQLLESPICGSTSPSASSSLNLLAGLTESMSLPAPSTPHSASSMSVGSDDPASSELTSYYCLNCDARHGLGSSDTPFICNAQYSSGEDSVDSIARGTTRRSAHHQVYAANNKGNTRHGGDGDRTPRSSRRASFENSASNRDSDYTIADEEWVAARAAVLNNTPLPAGTSSRKEKTTAQASGSKYQARDTRDEITQSRIDKARRRRAARKDDDSDSSDEDQEYDGELRGADCLSYKIRETMPPKKFKPTPTDAAKYDGQQEPRSWIDDYLQTVILHKGNQIAAMQCLQLYLKDSARAWLRGLPKGSIKSWDDLVDAFVANFQATYKRPVGIEELRNCQQKQKESMRSYIGRFTKLLNAAEDVSVDRAIDAFSDGVRRESYIEELGRKKPKTITKLMEIANSWADGEDNVQDRERSDDEDDDQPKHDSGSRRDRHKRRKNRNYDDNNLVAAGYSDRHDDRYEKEETIDRTVIGTTLGTVATINHGSRGLPSYPMPSRSTPPVTPTRMSTPRTAKRSRVTFSGTVGSSSTCTNSSSSQDSNRYHLHPHLHHSTKSSRLNLINPTRRSHHHVGR
ncbi:hypothetical protein QYE76_052488 [Lolium multiflorum]|uniref:Retrotransposon gag domain-containing protein n=1 Tax=Lolium multiflorum TaxID=4521 RepID=A0AAD8WJ90_LOLMU|nr:hypothetical protein QYE76_052488 [Lolium multiflorum]